MEEVILAGGAASSNTAAGGRPGLLVGLHPCFEGYAGIPQETRLLFAHLARSPDIKVGGLLDGGETAGSSPSGGERAPPPAVRLFAQTQQVIALDADVASEEKDRARRGGWRGLLPRGPLRRLDLLSRWGRRDDLADILDGTLFGDWLWTRLFQKGLAAAERPALLRATFVVPRTARGDAERLGAVSPRARPLLDLATGGWKAFLAPTPSPYRVSGGAMIVRYHDAIPLLWPHTIGAALAHAHAHFRMLERNVAEGAWFACDSEPSRDDLLRFFPQAEGRAVVVPVLSAIRQTAAPRVGPTDRRADTVAAIFSRCQAALPGSPPRALIEGADEPFILAVSTLEPRKNYGLLMRAFALARQTGAKLRLVVVANAGWRSEAELAELRRLAEEGSAVHLANVPVRDMEVLYANAHAVVCASRAEGFDLAAVEAMSQGAPVLASDIPVHRSVCGDAADYFDPYDEDGLARRLVEIAGSPRREGRLAELTNRGRPQAAKYLPEVIMPQWHDLLARVMAA